MIGYKDFRGSFLSLSSNPKVEGIFSETMKWIKIQKNTNKENTVLGGR